MSEKTNCENQSNDCNGQPKVPGTEGQCCGETTIADAISAQITEAVKLSEACSAGSSCCQNSPSDSPQEVDPPSDIS